jgi:uncharacterized protein (DUF362 family)
MMINLQKDNYNKINRRRFLKASAIAAAALTLPYCGPDKRRESVVVYKVDNYNENLRQYILSGLSELNIGAPEIKHKNVLLKPNLVEPHRGISHINTNPLLIQAAIEAFLHLGANSVAVGEGAGHMRDSYFVVEESGLGDVLAEDNTAFIDLNFSEIIEIQNFGKRTRLPLLVIPKSVFHTDIFVSMAKMKTHHWMGATLSMKNLFGMMPGSYYGWPKNVLHVQGIAESIFDINASVKPQIAIVDGIVGMEGDGPIMGTPVKSKVLVLGRNLPAVDATCARIMGLIPERIPYLKLAKDTLGPIESSQIDIRGENIADVTTNFQLMDYIPIQRNLRG